MSNNLSTTSILPTTLPTTTFAASITSQFNYLASGYPVLWSSDIHDAALLHHAQSCWTDYTNSFSQWESWTSSITAHNVSVKTVNLTSASSYTVQVSSTIYPTDVSIYRECDGSPRATNAPITTSFASTSSFTFSDIETVSPKPPSRGCQMSHDDCAIAWFGSNLGHFGSDSWIVDRLEGACGDPHDVGSPCVIQGGPARLYYFPVDTTEGCAANGTSATTHGPTNTTSAPPQPVTTLGTTFDPGSAYISFETLYAAYRSYQSAGGSAIQIGPTFSNTILALRSDEVSTNCYGRIGTQTSTAGWGIGTQLRYGDLNLPVPASAYSCANQCVPYVTSERTGSDGLQTFDTTSITPNPCETIWNNFNPLLAVPTKLREIVPEWATCSFYNDWIANVVFDPPTALRQATAEAKPTLSPPPGASPTNGGDPVTTPASPASTASPNEPANTAVTLPRQHSDSPSPASPTANSDPTTVPALADSTTEGDSAPSASPESQQNPAPQPQSQQPASPSNNSPANDPSKTNSPAPNTAPEASQGQSQNASPPSQSPENGNTPVPPAATDSPAQSEQQGTTIGFNTPASGAQTPQDTPQGTASPGPQASPASQVPAVVFTVGGNTLTAQQLSNSHVAVGGTTIPVGQGATLSNGAVVSIASNGIVINSAPAEEPSASPVFVAGSVTASPVAGTTNAAVVNGVTLTQGGSAVSSNGQVISFGSSGLQAVSGGQTQMFSAVNNAASQSDNVLVAGSITASPIAGSSSAVVVNGATLSAGGSAVVTNGQTISYGSSGLQIVSGGHTQAFSAMGSVTAVPLPTNVPGSPEVPLMTLDGAVYSGSPVTVSGTTGWKIGSQTLLPGSQVTLSDGEVATLSGSSLLVEKPTTTSSAGVGDAIASVMGLASDMMSMEDAETTSASTTESSRTSTSSSGTSTPSSEARKLESVSTVAFVFAVLALLAM